MLGDNALAETSAQLAAFNSANATHQQTLTEVLEKYGTLVDDYKRLKSDYEEERDAREKYKQLARGQERNPFVLVLVDGDGYIFNEQLVSGGAEGGQRAAYLLNDEIKASLRAKNLDNCRVMVRVYTNLAGLSKALSKHKLCGPEKRSLAAFAANFTRSNDLFDFVDAGELKENADFKIRAMFRQFVDNTQCRQIYFAGCHDVGYINELTPYRNHSDKITLVGQYNFHPEFRKLGMSIESLGQVFRSTPLDGPPFQAQMPYRPQGMDSMVPNGATTDQGQKICTHFQKGLCKYGNKCNKLHIQPNASGFDSLLSRDMNQTNGPSWRAGNGHAPNNSVSASSRVDENRDTRAGFEQPFDGFPPTAPTGITPPPPNYTAATSGEIPSEQKICKFYAKGQCTFGEKCNNLHIRPTANGPQPNLPPSNAFSASNAGSAFASATDNDFMRNSANPATTNPSVLPESSSIPPNRIPVNSSRYRLDPLIHEQSFEIRREFQDRIARHKLCNKHHLSGDCHDINCQYDHAPISEGVKECLKAAAKNQPCFHRGSCRDLNCTMGHVCQKMDCKFRGGPMWCRFLPPIHNVDMVVSEYVEGTGRKTNVNGDDGEVATSPEPSVKSPTHILSGDHWSRSLSGFGRVGEGAMISGASGTPGGSGKSLERTNTQGSDNEEGGAEMGPELMAVIDDLD